MLDIALRIADLAIALLSLDRLLLWMEARGWIYWRKVKSKSGAGDVLDDEDQGDDDRQRKISDRLTQRRQ